MNIHDHQAEEILKKFGSTVPVGHVRCNGASVRDWSGPGAAQVKRVLGREGGDIANALCIALLLDRATSTVTLMASTAGGMDIEGGAENNPGIFKEPIDSMAGLTSFQACQIAFKLGLIGSQVGQAVKLLTSLYGAFAGSGCLRLEINPLVVTAAGNLMAIGARFDLDGDLIRHRNTAKPAISPSCPP